MRPLSARTRSLLAACAVGLVALGVYWLANRGYDAGRGDFFYLADAFVHGRTWIDVRLAPWDVIPNGAQTFVPFAPFPAIILMPLVALVGPGTADALEPLLNAGIAGLDIALAWLLAVRLGVGRPLDRVWLVLLLGFSTPILWVTTRGGVWHTGQLVATALTLLTLLEFHGRRRPLPIGLLVGMAFLTRAPLAFAGPAFALWYGLDAGWRPSRQLRPFLPVASRAWALLIAGFLPALAFFAWYNLARFGSPFESGYALATLPEWLERQRQMGLFSLAHVPMNLDYLFLHLPAPIPEFPYLRPDGLGLSVLLTSPGLLLAARAPWRDRQAPALLLAAALVLVPTLLYYGGGWLQYGYRYFLDSIPFVWALAAMAVASRGRMPFGAKLAIAFGVLVNVVGLYWAYRL